MYATSTEKKYLLIEPRKIPRPVAVVGGRNLALVSPAKPFSDTSTKNLVNSEIVDPLEKLKVGLALVSPAKPFSDTSTKNLINSEIVDPLEKLKVCRICFEYGDVNIHDSLSGKTIAEHINSFFPMNITPTDDFSKWLCETCLMLLENVLKFKELCQSSVAKQAQIQLKNLKKKQERTVIVLKPIPIRNRIQKAAGAVPVSGSGQRSGRSDAAHSPQREARGDPVPFRILTGPNRAAPRPHRAGLARAPEKSTTHLGLSIKHEPSKRLNTNNSAPPYTEDPPSQEPPKHLNTDNSAPPWTEDLPSPYRCSSPEVPSPADGSPIAAPLQNETFFENFNNVCNLCLKTFDNQIDHTDHLLSCYEVIESHDNFYKNDEARLKDNTLYLCDICGKSTGNKNIFIEHRKTHINVFPFKCDKCPYRGRSKNLLTTHSRTHLAVPPYACPHCPQRFTTASNLSRHKFVHEKNDPQQCTYCKRMYAHKVALKKHIADYHSGKPPIVCNICGNRYASKKYLRKHRSNVHNIRAKTSKRPPSYLLCNSEKESEEPIDNNQQLDKIPANESENMVPGWHDVFSDLDTFL